MGGVSYHRLAAAVSEGGGVGCLGASTMGPDQWSRRSAPFADSPTDPSGSTCSPPCPGTWSARCSSSSTRARRCSSPGSEFPPRQSNCATATVCWWPTCAARWTTPGAPPEQHLGRDVQAASRLSRPEQLGSRWLRLSAHQTPAYGGAGRLAA
ncbi:MAG: hypothetical protein ACRDZY_06240, partial [Acidimicrobiales bacterium]